MSPRVLLRPASGAGVGGGHVLRCLALAEALAARGAACTFAVAPAGAALAARYGGGLHAVVEPDAAPSADAVVIDDYGASAVQERRWRGGARALLVIDDLADRSHACDLLLDPGFGRTPADYAPLAPGAEVLAGPRYALLRPAFAALSGQAGRGEALRRLLVGFGLSDVDAVAARAVPLLLHALPDVAVDVLLAGDAPSLPAIRTLAKTEPRLRLHLDLADPAPLMVQADAAVGAGGSSLWERAALGLPQLAVAVADNQRPMARALAEAGAVLALDLRQPDFDAALAAAAGRLSSATTRRRLRAAGLPLCDGQGAGRVADALLARL